MIIDIGNLTVNDWFGIAAFGVVMLSEVIYVISIFVPDKATKELTRPSRSTFWIWTAVQGMMAASYIASGESFAAGLSVAYALAFFLIAILSIRYGYSEWERTDTYCLLALIGTIILWVVSRNPAAVLVATVTADFIGAVPTIKKVREDPGSESRTAWALTVFACVLNFAAVVEWGWEDLVYTPYLLAVNALIAYAIWFPKRARA